MATSKSFNVGVIGYGMSAKVFHIPLIQHVAGLNLAAILQRTPKPDDDASKDHPTSTVYRDLASLLADQAIDLVVVTTTPDSHYEIAAAALAAGKHVIVEKPFAPTSKECEDLITKAEKAGKLLTVYQNRRWDLDFLTLHSLLAAGTLGRVADVQTFFDRHRPTPKPASHWKAQAKPGNGAIFDLGSHMLDQLVVLFGRPARVTGFLFSQVEGVAEGAEDSCTVLLQYANGLRATVRASVVSAEVRQLRFWVRGTKGSFKKFGLDTQEDALKAGATPQDDGFGSEPADNYELTVSEDDKLRKGAILPVKPETYAAFYTGVLAALRGEAKPPVDATEVAAVIKIIELAIQSSKEGRTLDFA